MHARFIVAAIVVCGGFAAGLQAQAPATARYAWAPSCKSCHEAIYKAWESTKHARALDRLSSSEQEQPCAGCHLTGSKTKITVDGKTVNGGVQCEGCHGAAAAHAADPNVRTGLVKMPPEEVCTACHNAASPKFKGFFYTGMLVFSHKVK
jgi:predicted CXXCH cytochrome family protein